jgi:hypothetical protein
MNPSEPQDNPPDNASLVSPEMAEENVFPFQGFERPKYNKITLEYEKVIYWYDEETGDIIPLQRAFDGKENFFGIYVDVDKKPIKIKISFQDFVRSKYNLMQNFLKNNVGKNIKSQLAAIEAADNVLQEQERQWQQHIQENPLSYMFGITNREKFRRSRNTSDPQQSPVVAAQNPPQTKSWWSSMLGYGGRKRTQKRKRRRNTRRRR